jgi:phage shock protein A
LKFSFVTSKANARLMVAFIATIFLKYPDMGEKDLIAQLRARIAQLEKENKELREKLAAAEAENKRSKDLVLKLENDTRTAQTKIVTLEKEHKEEIEKLTREMESEKARLIRQYEDRIRELEERSKLMATENGTQQNFKIQHQIHYQHNELNFFFSLTLIVKYQNKK